LMLVDVTTDIGIPCFLAVLDHQTCGAAVAGSGAALSSEHAATRAVQEVAQLWAIEEVIPEPDPNPDRLGAWPVLERCMRLDVSELRRRAAPAAAPSLHGGTGEIPGDFEVIRRALAKRDLAPLHSELTDPESSIAVVSCLVPGLERFSIVRHGHPVVPTGRGRAIWDRALKERLGR
jgi:ribosomal protein S12 methylthiotransferase accessory factor